MGPGAHLHDFFLDTLPAGGAGGLGPPQGSRSANFEAIFYRPIPEWYPGIAVASWATA